MASTERIFAKLRLKSDQLRAAAEKRFGDAKCLTRSADRQRANDAIYMGGFAIECLLKALLLDRHPNLRAGIDPAKLSSSDKEVFALIYTSHELDKMCVFLPELEEKLRGVTTKSGSLVWLNFQEICEQWTIQARYSPHSAELKEAQSYLDTVEEVKKMAQKTMTIPPYASKLIAALRKKLPSAQIDCEQVRRDRYRFIVVSPKFDRMGHPERQRLVWDLAGKVLQNGDLLKVSMIITMSRKEFALSAAAV